MAPPASETATAARIARQEDGEEDSDCRGPNAEYELQERHRNDCSVVAAALVRREQGRRAVKLAMKTMLEISALRNIVIRYLPRETDRARTKTERRERCSFPSCEAAVTADQRDGVEAFLMQDGEHVVTIRRAMGQQKYERPWQPAKARAHEHPAVLAEQCSRDSGAIFMLHPGFNEELLPANGAARLR